MTTPALNSDTLALLEAERLNREAREGVNYEESKVPKYTLPDPLVFKSGDAVRTEEDWRKRRLEILRDFEEHVYGRMPGPPDYQRAEVLEKSNEAPGGTAIRRQIRISFKSEEKEPYADILLYLPKAAKGPVPVFVGLNFHGNHTVTPDPEIQVTEHWVQSFGDATNSDNEADEKGRGKLAYRWPVATIVARGYGVATAYCGDFDPDFDDGFANGVHPLFYKAGQTKPKPNEAATIGAWSWGMQRVLDYLENDPDIDAGRAIAIGHSRLGKTVLWAAASDERFAGAISNDSGCGGAALSRREFGETVRIVNEKFPHWFCANFHAYNDREDQLPVDQHMLLALMAPRPVYVASALEDLWADPHGEFLAAKAAGVVYEFLDREGLAADIVPEVDKPVLSRIGYHIRKGEHDITAWDWEQYLDFADRYLQP